MDDRSFLKYKKYYSYIEPVFKDPVTRSYASLILFFLTISFFIAFAIRPTIKTMVSLNKQIQDGRITNEALQQKINALSIAQNEYTSLQPSFNLIYSSLPENPMVGEFLKMIEKVATASSISISSLQIQPVKLLEPKSIEEQGFSLRELTFSMNIEGKYRSLRAFVEILRRIQRVVSLDNVAIAPSRAKKENSLGLTFTAKAYFFK